MRNAPDLRLPVAVVAAVVFGGAVALLGVALVNSRGEKSAEEGNQG